MDGYISSHTGAEIDELLNNAAGLTDDIDRIETLVNRANTTAEGAEETASQAQSAASQAGTLASQAKSAADSAAEAASDVAETATSAQETATAAKNEADMLRERLIGNGTTISRYFGQAERQYFACDVKAGTYKFDGGDYMAVTDYIDVTFLAAGEVPLAHFTSNQFVGNAQERWIDLPSDAVICSMLVFGTEAHPFVAPGTITLKVIDSASLEGKLYE